MSEAKVGRWGKNLAVRIPADIAKGAGLADGERVAISLDEGAIVIRPFPQGKLVDAQAAAEEILAEAQKHSLGEVTIRELIEEGRRW